MTIEEGTGDLAWESAGDLQWEEVGYYHQCTHLEMQGELVGRLLCVEISM